MSEPSPGRGSARLRVSLLWHAADDEPKQRRQRLAGVFRALSALGIDAEPVVYSDESAPLVRERLLQGDGVLVWVNPITAGRDRRVLDALLRDVSATGVWVSAHPDVVAVLGTKEVLYRTRSLSWGSDVRLYEDLAALCSGLPSRLASGAAVLKRARGNGGMGVWKVELAVPGTVATLESTVRIEHAHDGGREVVRLGSFLQRFASFFEAGGTVVEQPFLPRAREGMVRCYVSGSVVAGFAEHVPRGFDSPSASTGAVAEAGLGFEKTMHGPSVAAFRALRDAVESEWLPEMVALLGLDAAALPAIWDIDFLRGGTTASRADDWVLCEINASCVSPFPEEAAEAIARTAHARIAARRGVAD